MIDEKEFDEFRRWKREQTATAFEKAFYELNDLVHNPDGKNYNATMPVRAFKVMAQALLLLKDKVMDLERENEKRAMD